MKINNKLFFKKKKYISLFQILDTLKISKKNFKNIKLKDIKDIFTASRDEITFLNSSSYKDLINKSKSKIIITNKFNQKYILDKKKIIVVDNVLLSISKITNLFYPLALNDEFDQNLKNINLKKKIKQITYGKNVLIGENVEIGKNSIIGHNAIIESGVRIGKNCKIGNNVIIKYSVIGDNVRILDGAIIGKKGFGFFPGKANNIRYPHIGMVIIGDNVEIGCNNTIDRGSLSNTIIGKNTYLDNQVHIAHNVKIGENCIITAQVGFAGSSKIGNFVMIGGQAGISGHLVIGNNVQIAGGSGVIKDIPNNSKVMGYPAKNLRDFLKANK